MQLSFLVAKALLEGDFASYFASLPSADVEPEPIVVREGRFERVSRMEAEERGTVTVAVMVVREVAENGSWRIVGLDTTAPTFKERDGSGRFVWAFDVILTVVRSL